MRSARIAARRSSGSSGRLQRSYAAIVASPSFGVIAISLVATTLGTATLPLWYWALPDGYDLGLFTVDTLLEAVLTAWLFIPLGFVTVWVLRGLAKFHASLAVELLGRH